LLAQYKHLAFWHSIPPTIGILAKENHLLAVSGVKWLNVYAYYLCDYVLIVSPKN
jgi:hypothetical protein